MARSWHTRSLLYFLLPGTLSLAGNNLPARAQVAFANNPLDTLPVQERVTLRQGKPVVSGENGCYTARILIDATPSQTWSVLTDYSNYSRFMPNVTASSVLGSNNNQHLFEEVDRYHVAPLITINARTRLAITETPQKGFSFQMVAGKLEKLYGSWTLQPVPAYPYTSKTQVLLTQQIHAHPKSVTPKSLFYNIFRRHVEKTMQAIRTEVARRSS
jgi:ribosome-associated toxin RatA of RatAB toxin-antitoxin module